MLKYWWLSSPTWSQDRRKVNSSQLLFIFKVFKQRLTCIPRRLGNTSNKVANYEIWGRATEPWVRDSSHSAVIAIGNKMQKKHIKNPKIHFKWSFQSRPRQKYFVAAQLYIMFSKKWKLMKADAFGSESSVWISCCLPCRPTQTHTNYLGEALNL